jgi:hypothetical protein
LAARLRVLYADFEVTPAEEGADFDVGLDPPSLLRRWYRPNVVFRFDGSLPFKPLPRSQAFALFETGLNWCVAHHARNHLAIHAAAIEKNGLVALLPAPPGSGKSTLSAGLLSRGWRLLSDEMALLQMDDGRVSPCPRPISLKNESIDLMRRISPESTILLTARETIKGTVAHMKPPPGSVRCSDAAPARWIVLPRFVADAPCHLTPLSNGMAFMELATNSFNYNLLGEEAFQLLGRVVDGCRCHELRYGNLTDALDVFDDLAERR